MKFLEEIILDKGEILNGNILKVDTFLNHQIDPVLMEEMGQVFYDYFKEKKITKIVTIESSGIAPALMCALKFHVPLVFAKKSVPSTMKEAWCSEVFSYTKNKSYKICIEKRFLDEKDHILFIDDFLANGEAFRGIETIADEAGAVIEGIGIVIDKAFQRGHQYIQEKGYDLCSLAEIKSFENGIIKF